LAVCIIGTNGEPREGAGNWLFGIGLKVHDVRSV